MKLKIQQISQQYGIQIVLDHVTFSTSDIQCLGIIGPSGSGKSTLLRILAGLDVASKGEIFFNENKLNTDENSLHRHRKSMGIVFQSFNLFPHLSAWDNLMLPLREVHKWTHVEASKQVHTLLEKFQLLEHSQKFPGQLSGGQKQRLSIIRSIAHNPEIIFFDEPTSALDPEMASEVLHMILDLKKEGRKIVLVTHQMQFVKKVADEIAFLSSGKLVEFAPSTSLFETPSKQEVIQFLQRIIM